jgi:hypothetical protein
MELKQEHMVGCLGLKPVCGTHACSMTVQQAKQSKANAKQSRVSPTQPPPTQRSKDLFSINQKRSCRQASCAVQSTPSDLSDLSPRQRVHCPPSPALACCRARARWQEVLGHLRGSCSSPWGLCSSTSAQVISLPITGSLVLVLISSDF